MCGQEGQSPGPQHHLPPHNFPDLATVGLPPCWPWFPAPLDSPFGRCVSLHTPSAPAGCGRHPSASLLGCTCPGSPRTSWRCTPPQRWPVSLGADTQSCLLPSTKTCSFPSENTRCVLARQRTAQVKWAVVSEWLCNSLCGPAGQGYGSHEPPPTQPTQPSTAVFWLAAVGCSAALLSTASLHPR